MARSANDSGSLPVHFDHAISGATLLRPGIQALINDAARGKFDVVYAEALDRISRDQEDVAGFYKRSDSPRCR